MIRLIKMRYYERGTASYAKSIVALSSRAHRMHPAPVVKPSAVAVQPSGVAVDRSKAVVSSSLRHLSPVEFGVVARHNQVEDHQRADIIGEGANLIGFGAKLS